MPFDLELAPRAERVPRRANGCQSLDGLIAVLERVSAWRAAELEALTTIRDGELYKTTHETFEAYCAER